MSSFYDRVIEDEVLAPYFTGELGDDLAGEDWQEHVELLADFWLAKILGEKTYGGNFIGAHAKMPHIKRETFERWLELFDVTAHEVYTPEIAEIFMQKGLEYTEQFFDADTRI